MPGLKIIEIVLGLTFVYLLMSLLCTAVNEYISGMLNKRGKELFRAVDAMLESSGVRKAFRNHPLISTLSPSKRLPSYIPARNFALALLNSIDYKPKLESESPPDSPPDTPPDDGATHEPPSLFTRLLDALRPPDNPPGSPPNVEAIRGPSLFRRLLDALRPPDSPPQDGVARTPPELRRLLDALFQESATEVSPLLQDQAIATILGTSLSTDVINTLTQAVTGAERDLQKLQNAVEVWFNNQMDRVSGAYKRYTQIALLLIGFVAAALMNVDTIRIWQTLATNNQLRESLVQRAIAFSTAATDTSHRTAPVPTEPVDTTPPATAADSAKRDSALAAAARAKARADSLCTPVTGDTAQKAVAKVLANQRLTCGEARAVIAITRAELDSTQLALGWSRAELVDIGIVEEVPGDTSQKTDSTAADTTKQGNANTGLPRDSSKSSTANGNKHAGPHLRLSLPEGREWLALLIKLVGLVLTAIAVSFGAPFWFDMLNKFINIRAAGRAPDERPKNPEPKDKRLPAPR